LTAGFVYHAYFTIYNALYPSPWAGAVAAFATSLVKVPIGNCMRVLQATSDRRVPTILHIGANIVRKRGPAALYSGYALSLIEDIIEMDVRMRIYYALMGPPTDIQAQEKASASASPVIGVMVGTLAGSVAAAITTPFDTMRSQLAFMNNSGQRMSSVQVLGLICKKNGPWALYRGAHLRATSIGLKAALYFACLEGLRTKASLASHVAAP
jgi:hypothetical protein